MLAGSLFSGVGGLDLGLHRAGFRHAFFAEQDAYRRGILARHWPGVPVYDDVRRVGAHRGERVERDGGTLTELGSLRWAPGSLDLLAGGFPCQDLSVAGRRRGFEGERSVLFFELARVADELVRPGGFLLAENVPGLLSSHNGRDFAVVLATLAELGFHDLAWRVLDSRHFGVPQRRRRVFILARRAHGDVCAQVLLEPEGGGGHLAPSPEAGTRVAAPLTRGSASAGVSAPGRRQEDDVNIVAPAIVKRYAKGTDSDATDAMVIGALKASEQGSHGMSAETAADGRLIVNALDRQAGGPDDNSAQANHLVTHSLTSQGFDASEDGTGRGTPLTTFDTEFSNQAPPMTDESGSLTRKIRKAVHGSGAVRRLTPTECERLQSWPDGWTLPAGPSLADVPQAAARLADPQDPLPDGPRYAAAGDGVTSNVAEWIGRRLLAHVEEMRDAA